MNTETFELSSWSIFFSPICFEPQERILDSLIAYPIVSKMFSENDWKEDLLCLYLSESNTISGYSLHGASRVITPSQDMNIILDFAEALNCSALLIVFGCRKRIEDIRVSDFHKRFKRRLQTTVQGTKPTILDICYLSTTGIVSMSAISNTSSDERAT